MNRFIWIPVLLLVFGNALVGISEAQFLSRDEEPYENYGTEGYVDYKIRDKHRIYDPFGTYLIDGVDIFRLGEYRTISPLRGSTILKHSYYAGSFEQLVITGDAYGDWSTKCIIGDAVRTNFTSLTLRKARLNGIRWDGTSFKNRFTLLASRVSQPGSVTAFGDKPTGFAADVATYLFGGHWQARLGSMLTFGASYVNLHLIDSLIGRKKSSLKGVVPSELSGPSSIYVIFSDDSPGDGSGARVYNLQMFVDGDLSGIQPEIFLIENLKEKIEIESRILPSSTTEAMKDLDFARRDGSWLTSAISFDNFETKMLRRHGVLDARSNIPFREANGTDIIVYKFNNIPPDIKKVSFRTLVANDYNITVASGLYLPSAKAEMKYWNDVIRSPGNIGDGSNLEWKNFDFDYQTGTTIYGANLKLDLFDMTLNAEYTNKFNYFKFPSLNGNRREISGSSYFVNILRPIGKFEVGGEYFKISPVYTQISRGNRLDMYNLVDDNDDFDDWADDEEQGKEYGNGVFPGLDKDNDGVIDINVNDNRYPDYLEPYLMYYSEPDEYVFGDDFNNNGVIDERENNNKPDYVYDADLRGYHGFVTIKPSKYMKYIWGHYRAERISGCGNNIVSYGKLEYLRDIEGFGRLTLGNITKKVKDNIPDPIYSYYIDPLEKEFLSLKIMSDLLPMRNSWVNTLFLETKFNRFSGLNVTSGLKYEINSQNSSLFGDGTSQEARDIKWGFLVLKADYTSYMGNFIFTPMIKYMRQKKTKTGPRVTLLDEYHLIPILRMDYQLTPRTAIRAGIQGFPFFKQRYRNLAVYGEDYDGKNYLLMLENVSDYSGYKFRTEIAYKREYREFVNLKDQSRSFTEYSIRLIFGE